MTHAASHHSVSPISRGKGHAATAAVAYASGSLVRDERTGETHDYRRKGGVVSVEVIGFAGSPADLANAAEFAEVRRNACVGRSASLALPHELPPERRVALARGYALWMRDTYGVAAVVAIHEPHRDGDARNHHAHIFTTDRRVSDDGVFGEKVRELNVANGGREEIERQRAEWAKRCNAELARAGVIQRVDHRSFDRRAAAGDGPAGMVPPEHIGAARTAISRKGQKRAARSATPGAARIAARLSTPWDDRAAAIITANAERRQDWLLLRAELRAQGREDADRAAVLAQPAAPAQRPADARQTAEALRPAPVAPKAPERPQEHHQQPAPISAPLPTPATVAPSPAKPAPASREDRIEQARQRLRQRIQTRPGRRRQADDDQR